MSWTKEQVEPEVIQLLKQAATDWDPDDFEIEVQTRLIGDLGLSSLEITHLAASITMATKRRIPFGELLTPGGEPISDLSVGELVNFIQVQLEQDYSEDAAVIRR
jgi:acyl carrier protein